MWRSKNLDAPLQESLDQFVETLHLDQANLIGKVYDIGIPDRYIDAGASSSPLTEDEVAELLGAAPPPIRIEDASDFIGKVSSALNKSHLMLPQGLVERVIGGWLAEDIVVLVGPTGCGKTTVARSLAAALETVFGEDRFIHCFLEVTPDHDLSQFLGYENLAGEFTPGQFANEALFVGGVTDPRLVILDEWNLAQIDSYFAPILSALETRLPMRLPGRFDTTKLPEDRQREVKDAQPDVAAGKWLLPMDTFILATCNSWLEEPETRHPISGPVKRRCRIISMPNVLVEVLRQDGAPGLEEFCSRLITREKEEIERRLSGGRASAFDPFRERSLAKLSGFGDLSKSAAGQLIDHVRILVGTTKTENVVTPGILRDLLLSIIYAEPGQEEVALKQEVSDKVLQQIAGETDSLETVKASLRPFGESAELSQVLDKLKAQSSGGRITPLV